MHKPVATLRKQVAGAANAVLALDASHWAACVLEALEAYGWLELLQAHADLVAELERLK